MTESEPETLTAAAAAVELHSPFIDEILADRLELETRSGRELTVDVVDGQLRIRDADVLKSEN